jgi:hypothetical protein
MRNVQAIYIAKSAHVFDGPCNPRVLKFRIQCEVGPIIILDFFRKKGNFFIKKYHFNFMFKALTVLIRPRHTWKFNFV